MAHRQISPALATELEKYIKKYPSMFRRGGDVLEYIFLSTDAFEWKNGSPYTQDGSVDGDAIFESFQSYRDHMFLEVADDRLPHLLQQYREEMKIRAESGERSKDPRVSYRYVSGGLGKGCLFDTIPEDALEIWKEGYRLVNEMLLWYPDVSEKDGWNFYNFLIVEDF